MLNQILIIFCCVLGISHSALASAMSFSGKDLGGKECSLMVISGAEERSSPTISVSINARNLVNLAASQTENQFDIPTQLLKKGSHNTYSVVIGAPVDPFRTGWGFIEVRGRLVLLRGVVDHLELFEAGIGAWSRWNKKSRCENLQAVESDSHLEPGGGVLPHNYNVDIDRFFIR